MSTVSLEEARRRYEDELLRLPNVTGVGIGERDGAPCIAVFVTRKVPEDELAPEEVVPRSLEGHPVDVVELGAPTIEER